MHDLHVVRAEIKAWERDFRSTHDRDPSVQDIRDQPAIAEKYKLYKKLNKAAAASSSQAPSTPTHPSSRAGVIPKSRAVESVAPLPAFNPFSPLKNKGKQRQYPRSPSPQAVRNRPPANPFATPAKYTSNRSLRPHQPPSSLSYDHSPPTAVSRARKRLRGEPVSPSPNKQKRQRVGPQLPRSFSIPMYSSSSDDEPNETVAVAAFNSSFVDDSPVKPPVGGRSFKFLFDDALPALTVAKKIREPVPAQPSISLDMPAAQGGRQSNVAHAVSYNQNLSADAFFGAEQTVKSKFTTSRKTIQVEPKLVSKRPLPRTSGKRSLDSTGFVPDDIQPKATSHTQHPLLPPSPPPEVTTANYGGQYQRKIKQPGASRKRAKLEDKGESDSPDDTGSGVKVVVHSHGRQVSRTTEPFALDPFLFFDARNHNPNAKDSVDANHHDSSTFTVDLPDKLRLVLAISPSRSHTLKQEHVVRSLLNGDRVGHYDASKGGDIWDVGEWDDTAHVDTEAEDEWEGEPVPWGVAEL